MDRHDLRGSVSLSVGLIDHHPEIIEACNARHREFFSHGVYNTRYSYGMSEAQERALIEDSIRSVQAATGQRIRGYMAPALTHTERIFDLLAENDFCYTCDLFQDDQPQPLKTRTGRLMSMPYSLEVNDVITYGAPGMTPWRYADILTPLFGLHAATFSRYRTKGDGFEVVSFEQAYFTDLSTRQVLDRWTNPYTGETVERPVTSSAPSKLSIGPDLRFHLDKAAPPNFRLDFAAQGPEIIGDEIVFLDKAYASSTPPAPVPPLLL